MEGCNKELGVFWFDKTRNTTIFCGMSTLAENIQYCPDCVKKIPVGCRSWLGVGTKLYCGNPRRADDGTALETVYCDRCKRVHNL